jgi:AmmeMemoRadiSam system protein A
MSPLCSDQRHELLSRARQAIAEAVRGERPAAPLPRSLSGSQSKEEKTYGAFVTLNCSGRLRGCVGQIETVGSLAEVVERCAVAAATEDARFAPVSLDDLAQLEIEISLLSPLEPVAPAGIEIGRHGLVVEQGMHRGLLLPQVAVERHWQWQRFIEETCMKAGLRRDAWKDAGTRTFAFTAEIFSDASGR